MVIIFDLYIFDNIDNNIFKPNINNMSEIISTIIDTITSSFNFTFCIIVNIATYLIIKCLLDVKHNIKIGTWYKRIIFIIVSLITSIVYYFTGTNIQILFNSIILAPVSWSWIFKPICDKLNIDYNSKTVID